jgi:hypothetical protein
MIQRKKINLTIQANSYVSLFCEAWLSAADKPAAVNPIFVKLGNPAIADLITEDMDCQMEVPGRGSVQGNIRKAPEKNLFEIRSANEQS